MLTIVLSSAFLPVYTDSPDPVATPEATITHTTAPTSATSTDTAQPAPSSVSVPSLRPAGIDSAGSTDTVAPPEPVSLTITATHTSAGIQASVDEPRAGLEYRWLSYDVERGVWELVSDWQTSPTTLWQAQPGTYWLRVEAREAGAPVGDTTIPYVIPTPVKAMISATNASWTTMTDGRSAVLLGVTGENVGHFEQKIYDVARATWIAGFTGAWNTWIPPHEGTYWTHFEAYDTTGKLTDTRTYTFGIGLNDKITGTAMINADGGGLLLGVSIDNPIGSTRTLIYDVNKATWIQSFSARWTRWIPPHFGAYWVTFQALGSDGSLADQKTFVYGSYPPGYDPAYPPIFTYGTLRPSTPASFIMPSYLSAEISRLPGYDLWVTNQKSTYASTLPWAILNTANRQGIVGNIIVFPPSTYAQALARLDRYEGISLLIPESKQSYERVLTTTRDGLTVWVYRPRQWRYASIFATGWKVPSGDYLG